MKQLHTVLAVALLAGTTARADVVVFEDEAAFLAAAPIVGTITFDDLPNAQVPGLLEIANVKFGTRGIWQLPGTCSAEKTLGANNIERRSITFVAQDGGAGAVSAIGFRLSTFAVFPPADFAVAVLTADGAVTLNLINDVVSGSPPYRGFASTSRIEKIVIQAVGSTQWNFCLDDVSHSTIMATAGVDSETYPDVSEMDQTFTISK